MRDRYSEEESERLYFEFFTTELKAYVALAAVADSLFHTGRVEAARQAQALAEIGYATLQRYLSDPVHAKQLVGERRTDLKARMAAFRDTLDAVNKPVVPRKPPRADNKLIATVAYQLWVDRGCPVGSPEVDWFRAEERLEQRTEPVQMSA